MNKQLLNAALGYHDENLCVIPVQPMAKKPALPTWEEFHTRQSTLDEINHWWNNGYKQDFNIGIVHGEVSGNYVTLDIDHNTGLMTELVNDHDYLFSGRIEQSGSGEGFHIPLRLDTLPDFGQDLKQGRLRGNRTWKTPTGHLNIRCRYCQTVAPPSIHPSGQAYTFIQTGPILKLPNLDHLIEWLSKLAAPPPISPQRVTTYSSDDLIGQVKSAWNVLKVFQHFGKAASPRTEANGELRLMGNGGLLLTPNLEEFYVFSDDFGGGIFHAWGYCLMGSAYDNSRDFYPVLIQMAKAAGIKLSPLTIPDNDKLVIVAGEERAERLTQAGFPAVGLPGNAFKKDWIRLFPRKATIYIMLDPGRQAQARAIAAEFKARGYTAYTCEVPVKPDEFFRELNSYLRQGKKY